MAKATKKTYINYKTAPGIAVYPKLDKPYKWDDASERSLPNPDGELVTKLAVPSEDAQPLIDLITKAIKDSGVKPKYLPYEDEETDGEKTGNVLFKLKAYGKTKEGAPYRIKWFDAEGAPIKGRVIVTGGSRIRLLGWISVAKMGCRLNIREGQIIDLAERTGEGFEKFEGGSFKSADLDLSDEIEDETTSETEENTDNDEF